jgi:hypothetical protein
MECCLYCQCVWSINADVVVLQIIEKAILASVWPIDAGTGRGIEGAKDAWYAETRWYSF